MSQNDSSKSLDVHLQKLIEEARTYPVESWRRRRILNDVIRLITQSGRLWHEQVPHYEDALQQTWLYFCKNLDRYDPEKASVITWLDKYLKWRLRDKKYEKRDNASSERLTNHPSSPDITQALNLEKTIRHWIETDPDEELRTLDINSRPDITAQIILLHRLPPEQSWKEIAQKFNVSQSTVVSFYYRHCLPCLRKFGRDQGYLD